MRKEQEEKMQQQRQHGLKKEEVADTVKNILTQISPE
jgi:hypothetical protein